MSREIGAMLCGALGGGSAVFIAGYFWFWFRHKPRSRRPFQQQIIERKKGEIHVRIL